MLQFTALAATLLSSFAIAQPAHQPEPAPHRHHAIDDLCRVYPVPIDQPAVPANHLQTPPADCGDRYVIDILWCYTPATLAYHGSEATILAYCELNVIDTNAAFANSQLPFSVRLVGLVPVNYDESGGHLALLQGTSDGVMDDIHAIRDAVAADIVSLITVDGYCGLAYVAPSNPDFGFQKLSAGCLPGSAFRHELGHNLGSKHWAADNGGFFPYSAGHILTLPGPSTAGTAMGGNALQHFSNPRVNYNGVPTGIAHGSPDSADNWLAFMQTAPMVAKFRCSGDCDANGIDDATEIATGAAQDCDGNGVPDSCQLDLNNNGTIDACEPAPVIVRVPEDLPVLQLAISMAEPGVHEIVVAPGNYVGPFDTLGKGITIRSSHGPALTTLTANGLGRTVSMQNGEGRDTVLQGFTLTGGAAYSGAGLYLDLTSPTIRDCVMADNIAEYAGGGARVTNGTPLFEDCTFERNSAQWGGGVSSWSGAPEFLRCTFDSNTSVPSGSGGGYTSWDSDPVVSESTFSNNTSSSSGGGLFIVNNGGAHPPVISDPTFCNNAPDHTNNNAYQNTGGNQFLAACPSCPADLNNDGFADSGDITSFVALFLNSDMTADFNNDGFVDSGDISEFVSAFLAGC